MKTHLINANSNYVPLADESVHEVVFSPPYWALRLYGTAVWTGGDPECEHRVGNQSPDNKNRGAIIYGLRPGADTTKCIRCGAARTDNQIGQEPLHDCLAWANGYARVEVLIAAAMNTFANDDLSDTAKLRAAMAVLGDIPQVMRVPSPPCGHCFVCNIRQVAREMWRVLRKDGTMWINLGDSSYGGKGQSSQAWSGSHQDRETLQRDHHHVAGKGQTRPSDAPNPFLKQKDLAGIPFRVAMALQADGWYWRTVAPWVKPNCKPESVDDRPNVAHEQILMFAKSKRYYYDRHAIKEPLAESTMPRMLRGRNENKNSAGVPGQSTNTMNRALPDGEVYKNYDSSGRNRRTSDWFTESLKVGVVDALQWAQQASTVIESGGVMVNGDEIAGFNVSTVGWGGEHYAVFPPELIEPMIKAGTSEYGCCPKCKAPWKRVTRKGKRVNRPDNPNPATVYDANSGHRNGAGDTSLHKIVSIETIAWIPSCGCYQGSLDVSGDDLEATMATILATMPTEFHPVPCVVLDPFAGSGTTLQVARSLGRNSVGLDLSHGYLVNEAKVRLDINRLEAWKNGAGILAREDENAEALPLLALMK